MKPHKIVLLPFILIFLASCTEHHPKTDHQGERNPAFVRSFLSSEGLENASAGLLITDPETGDTIAGYRSGKSLTPASVLKLLTSSAALETLGPDHTFKTTLACRGKISSGGTLKGDLIISGNGDPAFLSPRFTDHYRDVFNAFVLAVKKAGIKNIDGDIVGDAAFFGEIQIPDGWIWEDMGNYYGAPACGLNIYDNTYRIVFSTPDTPGRPATVVAIDPPLPGITFENRVVSSNDNGDNAYIYGTYLTSMRIITGTLPKGRKAFTVKGSIPDPPFLAARELYSALLKNGIGIRGKAVSGFSGEDTTSGLTALYEVESPPLSLIVKRLNTESVNLYAEILLLHLALAGGAKPTVENGCRALRSFWENKGMDVAGLFLEDGSGLSRSNGITPSQLLFVLNSMNTVSETGRVFMNSLPVAGVSGSLKSFGKGTPLEGNLRAKSGYMTRVMNYAGYLTTKQGHQRAFVVMVNNYNCSDKAMRKLLRDLLLKVFLFEE